MTPSPGHPDAPPPDDYGGDGAEHVNAGSRRADGTRPGNEEGVPWRILVPVPRGAGAGRSATEASDPVRALIRAQLRAGLRTCGIVLFVIVALPLLPVLAPGLGHVRPYGIPLPWMGLAFAAQPVWVVLALWHVRRGERIERDYGATTRRADLRPVLRKPCEQADPVAEAACPRDGA